MQPLETGNNSNNIYSYSLLDIVGTLWRWRKMIGVLVGASVVGTVLVSLLLSDYYTAYATFVPANEDKQLFSENGGKNNSLYGDDDAIDRALIFAESPQLIGYMIQTFKLAERYSVDVSTPKGQDRVAKTFMKLFKVKKNQYSGIELSIQDTDPQFAAVMVDSALRYIERLYRDATSQNRLLLVRTYESALVERQEELRRTSDTIALLRKKYAIYDVRNQGEVLGKLAVETEAQLAECRARLQVYRQMGGKSDSIVNLSARIEGLSNQLANLRAPMNDSASAINLERFAAGRDLISQYEDLLTGMSENHANMKKQYAQFKAQAESQASAIIILDPVQVPKIKSYPVRSLFVLGAAFLSLVLGCVAAILLDMYKRIDWKKVFSDEPNAKPARADSEQP